MSHVPAGRRVSLPVRLLWGIVALVVAAGFASLGFWQYGRAGAKQRWLDGYAAALQAPPLPLAEALAAPPPDVPKRIVGDIAFVDAPVLLLDNQQREGRVGVRAYALAQVGASAVPVLVELGWLPVGTDRALPQVVLPEGRQHIEGVLLPWPGQGLRLAENPWQNDGVVLLTYLDRDEIGRKTGTTPYHGVLQPDPALPLGYAREAGTLPNTLPPERHRGYAVQWWGLSITVLLVYLTLALRRREK